MTYEQALEIIESEYDTIKNTDRNKIIRTGMTYDGANSFSISIYDSDIGLVLSDLGRTKDIFDEVPEEEWVSLCKERGFRFDHWRIIRDFTGIRDVYDFIDFLDLISAKYFDDVDEV